MLREIRELGFEYAELSHGTRMSLVPGIIEAVEAGEMKISSLHNFCPLPMGVTRSAPNLYQFSSESQRERESAQRYTLKTIEFATRVKAPMVVLHLGSIDMRNYTDKLMELAMRREMDSSRYMKLCAEMDQKREKLKPACMERVVACLKAIAPEAESRGIRLGAENRQAVEELPIESDFQFLFAEVGSPNLVYWHDTGHAQIKENLGLAPHFMQLETLSPYLAGFHVHDVDFPGRDHCAPGSGGVDFAALKPLIKPEHIKVFELGPALKVEDVKRGIEHVRNFWGAE